MYNQKGLLSPKLYVHVCFAVQKESERARGRERWTETTKEKERREKERTRENREEERKREQGEQRKGRRQDARRREAKDASGREKGGQGAMEAREAREGWREGGREGKRRGKSVGGDATTAVPGAHSCQRLCPPCSWRERACLVLCPASQEDHVACMHCRASVFTKP